MTVQALLKILSEMNPRADVVLQDDDGQFLNAVEVKRLYRKNKKTDLPTEGFGRVNCLVIRGVLY